MAINTMSIQSKRTAGAYDEPTAKKTALGKRMKEAREIAGLSQAEAAALLGYRQAVQLSLMESGQRMPPARVLIACAVLYGTTMDFLCGLVDDSDRDPAAAVQREVAGRVVADVRRLITTITAGAVDAVRQLRPDAGRTTRLACQVVELASTLQMMREHDGAVFDELHAGAQMVARVDAALATANDTLAAVARVQRQAVPAPVDFAGIAGLEGLHGMEELAARLCRPVVLPTDAFADAGESCSCRPMTDTDK